MGKGRWHRLSFWAYVRRIAAFVLITLMVALVPLVVQQRRASAEGNCVGPYMSYFDGYGASGSYNGATYRGVVGDLITRLGYSCDSTVWPYTSPTYNFTAAWYMIAGPNNSDCFSTMGTTRGYSQAGYFRGNGQNINSFAETNADGCGPLRRILWSGETAGQVHRYQEVWFPWSHVMASQLDSQIGTVTQAMLYSDFDPVAWWGQYYNSIGPNGWEPDVFGETKDPNSDMPGHYGSSSLFYAIGSEPDGYGWIGTLGLNYSQNMNSARWYLGAIDAYNPNVYGLNFEIYNY